MSTTDTGHRAEAAVAEHLKKRGYKILFSNWRTRVCEIDIIASKSKTVYFVEVKYRSQQFQGDGLDYITPKKLKRLHFAAEIWNQQNNWNGDYRLLAASVSDELENNIEIIELD